MRTFLSVLLVIVLAAASCSSGEEFVELDQLSAVPVGDLAQTMLFVDAALVFTVTAETEGDYRLPERPDQSYEIPRVLTATVDEVVWTKSSADERLVPAAGDRVSFQHHGWWIKDGGQSRLRMVSAGKDVEVGKTYMAMFLLHANGPDTVVIAFKSTLLVDDGRLAVLGEDLMPAQVGMTPLELAEQMANLETMLAPLPERSVVGSSSADA